MTEPKLKNNILKSLYRYSFLLLLVTLFSCGGNHKRAPVRNLSIDHVNEKHWKAGHYKVKKSDTLYSIAFRFGIDYQQLIKINKIKKPYTIFPGQTIKLRYPKNTYPSKNSPTKLAKSSKPKKSNNVAAQQPKNSKKKASYSKTTANKSSLSFNNKKKVTAWLWPVKNNVLKNYISGQGGQPGLNIKGSIGVPIRASAAGRVVYSGNGLVGYGNLVIIKHNQDYLSAYAHNDKLLWNPIRWGFARV